MWAQSAFLVLALVFCDTVLVEGCCDYLFFWTNNPSGNITMQGDVSFNTSSIGAYDLNSAATNNIGDESCGRIRYKDRVRMVDKGSGRVASFNTSFTFEFVKRPNAREGLYGMAFTFVSSPNITELEISRKIGMCAFDPEDVTAANRAFAVTFDSFQDYPSDPSDSSIGVIVSNQGITTATHHNLCVGQPDPAACGFYNFDPLDNEFTVAIFYDGAAQTLEVYMDDIGSWYINGMPRVPKLRVANVRLDEVLDEYMDVALSASTTWHRLSRQIHRVTRWWMELEDLPFTPVPPGSPSSPKTPPRTGPILSPAAESPSSKSRVGLILGICGAILGAGVLGIGFCLVARYTTCFSRLSGSTSQPVADNSGDKTFAAAPFSQQSAGNQYDVDKVPANLRA